MGAGSGLGSAERALGAAGLEGSFAIGVTFREHRRDVDGLADNQGGVLVADTLFEDPAALVWGDDVQQGGHHVHGRDDHLAAVGQYQSDLVALEGVELFACDHRQSSAFDFAVRGRPAGRGFAAVVLFGPGGAGVGLFVRVRFDGLSAVEAVGFVVRHGRVLQNSEIWVRIPKVSLA